MKPLLFFDLEMNRPHLLEWGAIFNGIEESILVKQPFLGSFISKMTGISHQESLEYGKEEHEVIAYIARMFDQYTLVGFAIASSDIRFIRKRCIEFDIPYNDPEFIDLQRAEMKNHEYDHTPSLTELYIKYVSSNIPENTHRALVDAQIVKAIYDKNPDFWNNHVEQYIVNPVKINHKKVDLLNKVETAILNFHLEEGHFDYSAERIAQRYDLHIQAVQWMYVSLQHKKKINITTTILPSTTLATDIPNEFAALPKLTKKIFPQLSGYQPLEIYNSLSFYHNHLQNKMELIS